RLSLPMDRPRPPRQKYWAAQIDTLIPTVTLTALKQLSCENGATLYMTLLMALAVLLARYSGYDDIPIGSAVANRRNVEHKNVIGFFVNTVVMRIRARPEMTFKDLFGQVRGVARDAYLYQDVPFRSEGHTSELQSR